MNSNSSRLYGPSEVRDLCEPLDSATAFLRRSLSKTPHRNPLSTLKSLLGGTCGVKVSQSLVSIVAREGVGFSPTRGSNPHLAMSRKSATSAQTKSSTERVKRPALKKRRENFES